VPDEAEEFHPVTNAGTLDVIIDLGVAIHHRAETLADMIHKADVALYEARSFGRNRVCVNVD